MASRLNVIVWKGRPNGPASGQSHFRTTINPTPQQETDAVKAFYSIMRVLMSKGNKKDGYITLDKEVFNREGEEWELWEQWLKFDLKTNEWLVKEKDDPTP